MKKQLVYSGLLAIAILGITAGIIASNRVEASDPSDTDQIIALDNSSTLKDNTQRIDNKNENVYVITDADGTIKSEFIGSTLYTGNEKLPFDYSVQYYLDGAEIPATELAGKSGHVKMVYSFKSAANYNGAKIPFIALSGMQLNKAKFHNLKVSNGKVVSEGDSYTIIGYALPGVNTDLGTDFLPEQLSVEADVTDFELGTTYTVLTSEIFTELDTSKLSDIDELVNSINQLADGLDQIISGANSLSDGLLSALNGAKELNTGAATLSDGISSAASGANKLSDGISYLTDTYNAPLKSGATTLIASTLTEVNTSLQTKAEQSQQFAYALSLYGINLPLTTTTYSYAIATINDHILPSADESLTQAKNLLDLGIGIIGYTQVIDGDIKAGANELASGLNTMNEKAPELVTGANSLVSGLGELYDGSITLKDGLATFKTTGIDKLADFANHDLASFTLNARQMVTAAQNYSSFDSTTATSVKFIVKTTGIK